MLGGYQILDLTNINLELGADAVDITDSGVLKQLLNLREYIEKGYDFSRPLNNQLKPFQVRYRDKKADEEITATLWASLLVIDSGFLITASIPNYANLKIYVAFDEATDDDGNNYWVIDTAQVKYSVVASSGTKLYRHEINIANNTIVVLSDISTPITSESLWYNNISHLYPSLVNSADAGSGMFLTFGLVDAMTRSLVYFDSDAFDVVAIQISVNDIWTDTITEL